MDDSSRFSDRLLVTNLEQGSLLCEWTETSKPLTALGYHITRSLTEPPGSYYQINPEMLVKPNYSDANAPSATICYYVVYTKDSILDQDQWTPPFRGFPLATWPNTGRAIPVGVTRMECRWTETGEPPTALGYNIRRSTTGLPGTYQQVNGVLLSQPVYVDSGLTAGMTYDYIVYIVDANWGQYQWTPSFSGIAQGLTRADWWPLYR